jgi:hypothetical protein
MSDPAAAPKGPRGIPRAALVVVGLAGVGLLYVAFSNPPPAPKANPGYVQGGAVMPSGAVARNITLSPQQMDRVDAIRMGKRLQTVDSHGQPLARPMPERVQREIAAKLAEQQGGKPAAPMDPAQAAVERADILAAMKLIQPQVQDCYQQGLKQTPGLKGAVTLSFTLRAVDGGGGSEAASGEVEASTLSAPLVEACMLSHVQGLAFPALHGAGEVKVRYPFQLSPDQPTPHP